MPEHIPAGPHSLAALLRGLEELGGAGFNFGPSYFASLDDADRARIRTAKRLLATSDIERARYLETLTLFRGGATDCAWCSCRFTDLSAAVTIHDRLVHRESCREQFDAFVSGRVEQIGRASCRERV